MATVIAITPGRPAPKPARSKTYPLREHKTGNTRPNKKSPAQFDPDELKRRLEAHVAEQKLNAEQRRARESAKKQPGAYHHVPKVAAVDFQKTATPESMGPKDEKRRYIQKLGQAALKHQTKELAAQATITLDQRKNQCPDLARVQRDYTGERNHFQRTRDPGDATLIDEMTLRKLPQRTSGTDYLDINQNARNIRPLSTGDLIWEDALSSSTLQVNHFEVPYASDPQNWAQPDQISAGPHQSIKERASPFLRKPDSMWMLKGKKDPKIPGLHADAGQAALPGEPKHKKSMFSSLFKRQR